MSNAGYKPPFPINEPNKMYAEGSPERALQKKALQDMLNQPKLDIPVIAGGKELRSGNTEEIRAPGNVSQFFGKYHKATPDQVAQAIDAALKAKKLWADMPWQDRASIFLKAASMLAGKWRYVMNAATMLGQGKNVFQAEIDSACEMIDFLNFNVHFMKEIYDDQPISSPGLWNRTEYRPLEGFVFAVTPFNFTAIGGNLPTSCAMMGNTVVWKPASTAVLSAYYIMELLKEAGLPEGVINMVPGSGGSVGDPVVAHPEFAGIHFTGSTEVFQGMWKTIGSNIAKYKSYPRIVGETGGKDFLFAHPDCDMAVLATAMIRGAFEYQGQKCSALSRSYIPKSIWAKTWERMEADLKQVKMGEVTDFSIFMNAVIDKKSFKRIKEYIDFAKASSDAKVIFGGKCDDSKGYYIEPTVILTTNPHFKTIEEEIFGPVLTIYVYEDNKLDEALKLVDTTSPYALTGCVIARDRKDIAYIAKALENSAGNFYINDKPTGAVVGQQPFGGARGSGTNDKAGCKVNLLRWTSLRSIKENFDPPRDFRYPHMTAS